ncbi:Hypothetical predicted protein [Olea europaea subsp. europaea]|uniref:Uncharacterized protein n=1 Tax=Olea europaea subsp. europaea TaxID=158383 RepID=A0A8S0VDC4_OLEEU|nr:Hypothetical predicted protein [Olea europaea subsp. europaea]
MKSIQSQKPEAWTPEESEKLAAEVDSKEEQVDALENPQTEYEEEIGRKYQEPVDLLGLNEVKQCIGSCHCSTW